MIKKKETKSCCSKLVIWLILAVFLCDTKFLMGDNFAALHCFCCFKKKKIKHMDWTYFLRSMCWYWGSCLKQKQKEKKEIVVSRVQASGWRGSIAIPGLTFDRRQFLMHSPVGAAGTGGRWATQAMWNRTTAATRGMCCFVGSVR